MPKFSVRILLLITTVFAVLSWTARAAWLGSSWAIGFSTAMISVAVVAVIHALVFLAAFVFAKSASTVFAGRNNRKGAESPFAEHRLPPQLVTPIDPD